MKSWIQRARDRVSRRRYFHLHMVSDSTGETLKAIGRAVAAQYDNWRPVEHVTSMVRDDATFDQSIKKLENNPGIVLYTLVNEDHARKLHEKCDQLAIPAFNVLAPLTQVFDSHLGEKMSGQVGAQHTLDEDYFTRLDAIRFTMAHDDGNLPEDIESADIILIGISRTSKTPTSIYLAQRGYKTANVPLVPGMDIPTSLLEAHSPLIVALVASTERIMQVRENRLLAFEQDTYGNSYVDRASIQEELNWTRRLCKDNNWPLIDVTRRSIEETSAAILALRR